MISNLDLLLAASKPGDTIQLERGVYTTIGCSTNPTPDGQPLKQGVSLIGRGPDTVVLSIRPMEDSQLDTSVVLGTGDNVISDLTIDCNVTGTPNRKRNGVYCRGVNNRIERVHCKRPYGVWTKEFRESFALAVQLDDPNSSITDCIVSNSIGSYQTFIQGHTVKRCHVEGSYERRDDVGFRMAYNVGKSKGSLLSNCTASYVTAGVYCDEPSDGITVEDCEFHCVRNGLFFNAQQPTGENPLRRTFRNVNFRRNSVYLDPTRAGASGILLEHIKEGGGEPNQNSICDVTVSENEFLIVPGLALAGDVFAFNIATLVRRELVSDDLGISKVRFINNVMDPRMRLRNHQRNADVTGTVLKTLEFEA